MSQGPSGALLVYTRGMIDLPIGTGFFYRRLTIRRLVWAFVLFHLIRAVSTVQANYEGAHLNDRIAQANQLRIDIDNLQAQIAVAGSLVHLESYARANGLVPLSQVQFAGH